MRTSSFTRMLRPPAYGYTIEVDLRHPSHTTAIYGTVESTGTGGIISATRRGTTVYDPLERPSLAEVAAAVTRMAELAGWTAQLVEQVATWRRVVPRVEWESAAPRRSPREQVRTVELGRRAVAALAVDNTGPLWGRVAAVARRARTARLWAWTARHGAPLRLAVR